MRKSLAKKQRSPAMREEKRGILTNKKEKRKREKRRSPDFYFYTFILCDMMRRKCRKFQIQYYI
jgi:hypothetical protein